MREGEEDEDADHGIIPSENLSWQPFQLYYDPNCPGVCVCVCVRVCVCVYNTSVQTY